LYICIISYRDCYHSDDLLVMIFVCCAGNDGKLYCWSSEESFGVDGRLTCSGSDGDFQIHDGLFKLCSGGATPLPSKVRACVLQCTWQWTRPWCKGMVPVFDWYIYIYIYHAQAVVVVAASINHWWLLLTWNINTWKTF